MKRYQKPATYVLRLEAEERLMKDLGTSSGAPEFGTAPAHRAVPVTKPAYRTLIGG